MTDFDSKINYFEFYEKFIENIRESDENQFIGICPFHTDKAPSFSFNSESGLWKCFAGCGEGNIFTFIADKEHITESNKAISFIEKTLGIKLSHKKVIDKNTPIRYHKALLKNFGALEWMQDKRGLEVQTLIDYQIGIKKDRITIPVYDQAGDCRNIRLYAWGNNKVKATQKMISYWTGSGKSKIRYGAVRLYPIQNLDKVGIVLCEGEMDALLLNQQGFNAITVTGGAGSFKMEWCELFKNKKVYICFDIDAAGSKGALRVAKMLYNYAEWIKIVNLKNIISEPKNADITDYFVSHNYTSKDFADLLKASKTYEDISIPNKKVRSKTYKKVNLSEASHSANAMRYIELDSLVAGKNFPPYEIPNKLNVSCDGNYNDKVCPFCPMYMESKYKKTLLLEGEFDHGSLLSLIDISDSQLFMNVRKIIKVPTRCDRFAIDVETYINIEEISLIPEIDFSTDENYEYVQQTSYHIGHGIRTNQIYNFKGIAIPDPRTQQATQLFQEAKPTVDSIDQFEMTPKILESLEQFQPKKEGIDGVMDAYFNRYENTIESISGIYERMDIALAYDIVLHSPLNLMFQNKKERGWMECLLIGDSGCGKTELAKSMIQHYKVAEFVTGESATVAGLIGGLSQTSKRWILNWGKIPLNNRRALFIDEVSGMSVDDIGLFSGVRSSGIAELTKIRTEKTHAMTRKIWIGNPRKIGHSTRNLMEYPYGVVAVRELIGNLEDIRRFDFIVTAHSGEVDRKIYNRKIDSISKPEFNSKQCHDLIMWIWSRKKEQVKFQSSAVDAILQYANDMGEKYYHGIPVVVAADQRLKLARGAAAVAGMMFSTNKIGDDIIVKKHHVEFFFNWLERIYSKESMRYDEWSKAAISKQHLKDEKAVTIAVPQDVVEMFVESDVMNISIITDMTGWDRSEIKNMLSVLIRNNALKRVGTSYYRKTEAFITYLNKRMNNQIEMPEGEKSPDEFI